MRGALCFVFKFAVIHDVVVVMHKGCEQELQADTSFSMWFIIKLNAIESKIVSNIIMVGFSHGLLIFVFVEENILFCCGI